MKLLDSLTIFTGRPLLILLLAFPTISYFSLLTNSKLLATFNFLFDILGFILIPAIYGMYLEDIKGNPTTLLSEFKKHFGEFFLVTLTLMAPLFLIAILMVAFDKYTYITIFTGILLIQSLTIYVLPIAFTTGYIYKSISSGILYLISMAKVNQDLIAVTILSVVLATLAGKNMQGVIAEPNITTSFVSFLMASLSNFLSCIVFIVACTRLKEEVINV